MKDNRAKEAVEGITRFVNSMSLDQEEFNSLMSREHRTLQQSFTRLCIGWLEHVAKDEYATDLRNQASKKFAQQMVSLMREKTDTPSFGELRYQLPMV
jgi:hypothetical protein